MTNDHLQFALESICRQGGPQRIAAFFQSHGIRGRLGGDGRKCPLAIYLQTTYGVDAESGWSTITVINAELHATHRIVAVLPDRLAHFIEQFERGSYPFLIGSDSLETEPVPTTQKTLFD